jgi:hypothetical protein
VSTVLLDTHVVQWWSAEPDRLSSVAVVSARVGRHSQQSSPSSSGGKTIPRSRRARSGITDAALIDEALGALLLRQRAAEIDASYSAYDEHPLDKPDDWGDLASFRRAAAASGA